MKTTRQRKHLIARLAALIAERDSEYTRSLGPAAVKCVQEAIDQVTAQLA